MKLAILVCTYKGDKIEPLKEMLESVFSASTPIGYKLNLYLHIDGEIDTQQENLINAFPIHKIIKSNINIGLAKGLNLLIDSLDDEIYIFRMDADDLMEIDRLNHQIKFMDANPEVDFSGGAIAEFLENANNIVSKRFYPNSQLDILRHIVKGSPFAHVTICFRNDFFNKFGMYPTKYLLNEDIAFWYKALKAGAIGANVDKILVRVRMDGAYGRRTMKKSLGELRIYLRICYWLKRGFIYPPVRFLFRLFPERLIKTIYNSKFRNIFLNKS